MAVLENGGSSAENCLFCYCKPKLVGTVQRDSAESMARSHDHKRLPTRDTIYVTRSKKEDISGKLL